MARARPHHNPVPRQLTLDGWAEALRETQLNARAAKADGEAKVDQTPQRQKTTPVTLHGVVSGRSQTRTGGGATPVDSGAASTVPTLMTTREAAAMLRVHPRTVQRLVERGELEAVHLGTAVRFDPGDVAELTARLKRREAGTTPSCADVVRPSRAARISFAHRRRSHRYEHRADQA
jgi:excisionase family DNA binding protein